MHSFGRPDEMSAPDRLASDRPGMFGTTGRVLLLVLIAGFLAQCSTAGVEDAFVDSGTFQYHDCAGLKALTVAKTARLKVLDGLTQKAEEEPAGVIVAATTYRSEQATLHAELRNIRRYQAEKKCGTAPPA